MKYSLNTEIDLGCLGFHDVELHGYCIRKPDGTIRIESFRCLLFFGTVRIDVTDSLDDPTMVDLSDQLAESYKERGL